QVEARGETIRELLEDLSSRFPGLGGQLFADDGDLAPFVNVYLGREDVRTLDGLDTPVTDGATVILLPAMAGGALAPLAAAGTSCSALESPRQSRPPRGPAAAGGRMLRARRSAVLDVLSSRRA